MILTDHAQREVALAVSAAKTAIRDVDLILSAPGRFRVEALEDALNALQEAGWKARRAFSAERSAGNITTSADQRERST